MTIQLEPEEQKLWEAIKSFAWHQGEYEESNRMLQNQRELTKMLLSRNGIPPQRLAYFLNPDFNPGGRNKSRKEIFESNGTRGDAILKDGNFTKHLKFMIDGPSLAQGLINEATELYANTIFKDDFPDVFYSRMINRTYIKTLGYHKSEFADQIFNLLIDLGVSPSEATRVKRKI